jgi:hypothetical protein
VLLLLAISVTITLGVVHSIKKGKEVNEVYVVQPPTGSRDSFVAKNLRGKVPFGIADENDPRLEAFKWIL